jgi:hypothetical protein
MTAIATPVASIESCRCCAAYACNALSGAYHLLCLPCCARLVRSARPVRAHQEAMLAVIDRQPGAPTRADVLQLLKEFKG